MDAALDLLTERGVLAGLNLREVADRVGVTPANIYHLFGSRQGLLRAALTRDLAQMRDAIAQLEQVAVRVAAAAATARGLGQRRADEVGARPVVELAVRDPDDLRRPGPTES